jgi:hypothetical protein
MSEITLKKSGPGEETVFCDGLKCAYLSHIDRNWSGPLRWQLLAKVGGLEVEGVFKTRKAAIDWVKEHGHKLDRVEFKL